MVEEKNVRITRAQELVKEMSR